MIVRAYEREGLRVEIIDSDRFTSSLTARLLIDGKLAGQKRCDTITDAVLWARRWLNLDEATPLELFTEGGER